MAARIIHVGADNCHRVWVLEHAGYAIDDCGSVPELRTALQSEEPADAVLLTEGEGIAPQEAVSVVRAHSSAPIVLFRQTLRSFPESAFDLVIPVLSPPESWLHELAALLARSQIIRAQSEQLCEQSRALRRETEQAREKSRRERERSCNERNRRLVTGKGFVPESEPGKEN